MLKMGGEAEAEVGLNLVLYKYSSDVKFFGNLVLQAVYFIGIGRFSVVVQYNSFSSL